MLNTFSSNANLTSNLGINYTLLKGLELHTNFGYTFSYTNQYGLDPTTINDPGYMVPSGSSAINSSSTNIWIIEPQVKYGIHFGKGVLSSLLGGTFQGQSSNSTQTSASGFISDALLLDIAAASMASTSNNSAQNKYEAFFGRLNFNWDDKYLLNLNGRRDGTTLLWPGALGTSIR